jgi:glycosyltransferase involved in cell wall biosynthesis
MSNDPNELRKYCIQLLNEPEYARELGNNARKTIEERFSLLAFVNNWNNIFDRAYGIIYTGEK